MNASRFVSLFGLVVFMAIAWLLSSDRRLINWRVIVWGTVFQLFLGALVFLAPGSREVFLVLNELVLKLLSASQAGQEFIFGVLGTDKSPVGFILVFQALPAIIFFSALMGLLYYWGIMPFLIRGFAWTFTRLMGVSGAESLCTACNIFVGIESLAAIRPHLSRMTQSELCTILAAGMATVASSMLGVYVLFLKDVFPEIAGHLISASIMSAPAALIMSKLICPERAAPVTLGLNIPMPKSEDAGAVDAAVNGAMAGIKLVMGVVALLMAFLSLLALMDMMIGGAGRWFGADLSLSRMLGWLFVPLAWCMGIPAEDCPAVGDLLGLRLVATEVPAYRQLAGLMASGGLAGARTSTITTYALCGFSHVASLAIFVGGVTALVPERRADVVAVSFRALLAASLACLMTGAVAGVFCR